MVKILSVKSLYYLSITTSGTCCLNDLFVVTAHNLRNLSFQFSVVVYNSLAQPRTSWIRIPVVNNNSRFVVKDANGGSVASEVSTYFSFFNTF